MKHLKEAAINTLSFYKNFGSLSKKDKLSAIVFAVGAIGIICYVTWAIGYIVFH